MMKFNIKAALFALMLVPGLALAQENSGFSVSTVGGTASAGDVEGYQPNQIADAVNKGYGPLDAALYNEAQDTDGPNAYTPACQNDLSSICAAATKTEFVTTKQKSITCSSSYMTASTTYAPPTYGSCSAALDLSYGSTPADIQLWDAANNTGQYGQACTDDYSKACTALTKSEFSTLKTNVDNCGVYSTYASCLAAVALNYGYTSDDVTQWDKAVLGTDNAVCQGEYPTRNCNLLYKSEYTTVQNLISDCEAYVDFATCKAAMAQGYRYTSSDVSTWTKAVLGTDNVACGHDHPGKTCSQITNIEYAAVQASLNGCTAYSSYAICKAALPLGYTNSAADNNLRTLALADTGNNAACITQGGLAAGTANACAQLTKVQYDSVYNNLAVLNAVGNAALADALTVAQITQSSAYTGFTSHGTTCSTKPSVADVTANFGRFKHFLKNASFQKSQANLAKQLCYAIGGHSALTWHKDAPTSYIIAANNAVTNATDWRNCGFWGNRTAISKTSTNAQKAANRTIIYDVKSQDSNVYFTTPSISSDKGHAVLNYTLDNQTVMTGANVTLSVLSRSADGFVVASAPDRDVTVDAQGKIETNDALYKVFQRTASSSTWSLQSAINSAGDACPSGYSFVSTTNSGELETLRNIAIKHGTGAGTMPSGHRMEQCSAQFLECNAGFSACSNPNGSNWRMRLMIYGDKGGQVCAATRKKASGGGFYTDKTDWPSGFSMYPPEGKCADVGTYWGTPRLANGCVGWCWVRALCKKDGNGPHTVWP
ncbi:MAG: hypothetical protein ACON49_07840 [Candidatus Puniceispirillaceae bacterium]